MSKRSNKLDTKLLGKVFYDVVDVSTQKVIEKLIESSRELDINQEKLEKLSFIIKSELETTKSWGFDTLSKNLIK